MKKTLAAACLAFVACIPFIARSAPQAEIQFPILNSLSREDLIKVVGCLANNRTMTVDSCVAQIKQVVVSTPVITSPVARQLIPVGSEMSIKWTGGVTGAVYNAYLVIPGSSATSTASYYIGGFSGSGTVGWKVPATIVPGEYQVLIVNNGVSQSRSGTFKILPVNGGNATSTIVSVLNVTRDTPQGDPININLSPVDGARNVPMVRFTVTAQNATATITRLDGFASSTAPSTVYLYDGNTLISSAAVVNGSFSFTGFNYYVQKNQSVKLVIKADYPASTRPNPSTIVVNDIYYFNGAITSMARSLMIGGDARYLSNGIPSISLITAPTITSTVTSTSTSRLIAVYQFRVTANGMNITMPTTNTFSVKFANGLTQKISPTSVAVVTTPNYNIANGSTANVTVSATLMANATSSALYTSHIDSITWNTSNGVTVQTTGLENFKTPVAARAGF